MKSNTEEIMLTDSNPEKIIKTTTTSVEPNLENEHPVKTYKKKKVIFRTYEVVWYILGIVEVLLAFRILLKVLGANPFNGFTNLIYNLSNPLAIPFSGIVSSTVLGVSIFEWSTLIAMAVYAILAYGIVKLIEFVKPVTPDEVRQGVDYQI